VYGEDATDVGSVDARPVVLRTVKRDLGYRPLSNRQATAANFGRVEFVGRGATINSELYIPILKKLEQIRNCAMSYGCLPTLYKTGLHSGNVVFSFR